MLLLPWQMADLNFAEILSLFGDETFVAL